MKDEKNDNLIVMERLNANAYALESDIEVLKKQLLFKEEELQQINDERTTNQHMMDEVDCRFSETLNELQGRERELKANVLLFDTESLELQKMTDALAQSEFQAEQDMTTKNNDVQVSTKEYQTVNKVHSDLWKIHAIKKEHLATDEEEYNNMMVFASKVDLSIANTATMEKSQINIEANIEEYRSSLESIEQKIPTLEGQKKRAVASKNFKQCKSIVAEIKSLTAMKR